jgi:hypothetical protein
LARCSILRQFYCLAGMQRWHSVEIQNDRKIWKCKFINYRWKSQDFRSFSSTVSLQFLELLHSASRSVNFLSLMVDFSLSWQFYAFLRSMKSDLGLHLQTFRWRHSFRIGWIIPFCGCHLPDVAGIVPLALSHLPSLAVPYVMSMWADLRPLNHFIVSSVQTLLSLLFLKSFSSTFECGTITRHDGYDQLDLSQLFLRQAFPCRVWMASLLTVADQKLENVPCSIIKKQNGWVMKNSQFLPLS